LKFRKKQLINAIAVLVQKGNSFFHNFVFGSREFPGIFPQRRLTTKRLWQWHSTVIKIQIALANQNTSSFWLQPNSIWQHIGFDFFPLLHYKF